jgi:hypothetical protein
MRVRRRGGGKLLAFDWVSQPSALWRRCRLWKISSHAKIALASSTRVVHRLRSSSSVGIRPQNASMTALSASPIVSSARSPVGTPAVEHHDGGRDTRRPSSRRVGAFRLGSMLLALHQAGDRFVNDPDGTAGSSRKAPVARDGRRFTGGPRGTCGATDIFAAWRPWVRVWSTRCLCVGAHSSGGVP